MFGGGINEDVAPLMVAAEVAHACGRRTDLVHLNYAGIAAVEGDRAMKSGRVGTGVCLADGSAKIDLATVDDARTLGEIQRDGRTTLAIRPQLAGANSRLKAHRDRIRPD